MDHIKNKNANFELTLCSIIYPGERAEINSVLLAESIRAFGGNLASCPVWFMFPETNKDLTSRSQKRLEALNIQLVPFPVEADDLNFFFKVELIALSLAETLAEGQVNRLVWLDSNTLLLHEPKHFLLPFEYKLAYKPVHHLLLGSKYDQPIDPFWKEIYTHCDVPQERIFPMRPMVEDVQMRPYFNAGILVTRPQQGLLRHWFNKFQEIYQMPAFRSFYLKDPRFKIFMHQAVLAGMILNQFDQTELLELPENYNYPAHLWIQDKTDQRPNSLDKMITLRHEGFYNDMDWQSRIPLSRDHVKWLSRILESCKKNEWIV